MSSLREDAFAGRTVFVTGGTRGIGAAVANSFHEHGARVAACGRSTSDELAEGVEVHRGDVTEPGALESVVDRFDRLDVLVNCAGIIRRDEEFRPEEFERVVSVNLSGTMRACSAARERLAESGGCIINTASMLSYFGGPKAPGYSASKGGVVQLTKSLAVAYAAEGIRVNALAPGWIVTAMTGVLQEDPEADERILARTPMGRWGSSDEVAGAALFLASPKPDSLPGRRFRLTAVIRRCNAREPVLGRG